MLCFNSTNGLHKTKVISTFGFRIQPFLLCGENVGNFIKTKIA